MPYLTPETLPLTDTCRRLLIPDSPEWLALVSGALTELLFKWNWQEKGITIDETLAALQVVINSYYDVPCESGCEIPETPGGAGIIRRWEDGTTQQIIDGVWTTPEGVYTPLPPEPREETTDDEKKCLAATNAVNALKLTYEAVQTDWEEFQDVLSAIETVVTILEVVVASFAAYTAAAIIELGQFLFTSVLQLFAEIAENTWEDSEAELICLFIDNATVNGDDTVTFDFGGIRQQLFEEFVLGQIFTDRSTLGLQLDYFLYYIGAEGIDYAGGLTAIEEAECDDCDDVWCYYFDFAVTDGGFVAVDTPPTFGTWVSGSGWQTQDKVITITNPDQARRFVDIVKTGISPTTLTRAELIYDYTPGSFPSTRAALTGDSDIGVFFTVNNNVMESGEDLNIAWSGTQSGVTVIHLSIRSCVDQTAPYVYNGSALIRGLRLEGTGVNPFGDDNCPE